jgi:phosphoribosylanthranilate isomerase
VMLSGRLNPGNVAHAVARVRPWSVDAARGLESSPGIKDADAMRAFVANALGVGS